MATLNEIVFDVLEDVKSHQISNNLDIDERQVIYKLNLQRSLWVRNEYNKPGRTIDPFMVQSLGCVEVEAADSSDCPDLPVGCTLLRTKCELPHSIELHDRVAITKVGSIDKLNYFYSFIPYAQAPFAGHGKFSKDVVYAFIHTNRMYFKVNDTQAKFLTKVNIMGVFEDPTLVESFCNTDGSSCFSKDSEYPVSSWLIPYIKENVVKELIMGLQMPEDNINDANNTEQGNVKQG
jgi:hypothetical protein